MHDKKTISDLVAVLKELGYNERTRDIKENTLSRLFNLGERVGFSEIAVEVKRSLDPFLHAGILIETDSRVQSTVRTVPYRGFYYTVDSPTIYRHVGGHYTYIGQDGLSLCDFVVERMGNPSASESRHLDLCTGSGVVGLSLTPFFDEIICTDIDTPAIEWAQINRDINDHKNADVIQSDLYKEVDGRFTVITANPSFSIFPASYSKKEGLQDHEVGGGKFGLELTVKILEGLETYLEDGGQAFVCTQDPVVGRKHMLVEEIAKHFEGRDYDFEIHYEARGRHQLKTFPEFYKSLGISKIYFVIIAVRKNQPFAIRRVPMSRRAEVIEWAGFTFGDHPAYRAARRIYRALRPG